MDAVVGLPFSFTKPKLRRLLFSRREIADGGPSLYFHPRREVPHFTVSCVTSDGNQEAGPPRMNTRSWKGGENKISEASPDGESSEEKIIALFRRIQTSISQSQEGSSNTKKRNSISSKDKSSAESVLEVLRQSTKQAKVKASDGGNSLLSRRRGVPKKDQNSEDYALIDNSQDVPEKEQKIDDYAPTENFKLTRPPSNFVKKSPIEDFKSTRPPTNFVKKSPISSPSISREVISEPNNEELSVSANNESQRVKSMKLPELKELAKSRGIKGYSRLKKSELLELLVS